MGELPKAHIGLQGYMVAEGPRPQMDLFNAEREAAAKDCDTFRSAPSSIQVWTLPRRRRRAERSTQWDNVRQSFHSE